MFQGMESTLKEDWNKNDRSGNRNRLSLLIHSLFFGLDKEDHYTYIHSKNVANYARGIGETLGLSNESCDKLFLGGLIHDIGKLDIPDTILNKPGRLTDFEFNEMKKHTIKGYDKLLELGIFNQEEELLDMVLSHHERLDGSGYPYGKAGDDLSLYVRIMGVADSFDAMTSNRVYRNRMGVEFAINELEKGKGSTYDEQVVEAMKRMVSEERTRIYGMEAV